MYFAAQLINLAINLFSLLFRGMIMHDNEFETKENKI